jgi:putative flippase GtrA
VIEDPVVTSVESNAAIESASSGAPARDGYTPEKAKQGKESMRNSTLQMIQSKVTTPEERNMEMRRFAKFATVGAMGFVTQIILVNLLVQVGGVNETLANAAGFIAAVVQNFFLNRRWTFPESRSRDAGRQLVQFFIVSIVGFFLNMAVFTTVHYLLEPMWMSLIANPRLAHAVSYNFAMCVAVGVVFFWNFAANRMWTYRGLSREVAEAGPQTARE